MMQPWPKFEYMHRIQQKRAEYGGEPDWNAAKKHGGLDAARLTMINVKAYQIARNEQVAILRNQANIHISIMNLEIICCIYATKSVWI